MMLLWIRRIFSTRSAVYIGANWLDKDCIQPARMLEKKRLIYKLDVSAHPILCISSGLSTAELLAHRFFACKTAFERCSALCRPGLGKSRLDLALLSALPATCDGRHRQTFPVDRPVRDVRPGADLVPESNRSGGFPASPCRPLGFPESASNVNRELPAKRSCVGMTTAQAARDRVLAFPGAFCISSS